MAYKAFIIGINTIGLKYCDRDAALMKDALSRHGYDTCIIDKPENKFDILPRFAEMSECCLKVDSIIFYFSGHGMIERGELFFITKGDGSGESNKIPVNEILGPVKRSLAKNKLIILDCCHAGRIEAGWDNPEPNDVYRILMAANPLETAKEIEDLGASFLTHRIHLALTEPSEAVLDNGKIRINKLSKWLGEQADLYNGSSLIKVPQPYLIGADKANFEVCTFEKSLITPIVGKTIIDYNELINELKEWKVIHTRSQSLQDNLATMIKYLDISRFKPDDFINSLGSAESEWTRCAPSFRNIKPIVNEFRCIADEEAVQQLLPYANKICIKSILDDIRTAKSPEDALNIQRSIVDIKQESIMRFTWPTYKLSDWLMS